MVPLALEKGLLERDCTSTPLWRLETRFDYSNHFSLPVPTCLQFSHSLISYFFFDFIHTLPTSSLFFLLFFSFLDLFTPVLTHCGLILLPAQHAPFFHSHSLCSIAISRASFLHSHPPNCNTLHTDFCLRAQNVGMCCFFSLKLPSIAPLFLSHI